MNIHLYHLSAILVTKVRRFGPVAIYLLQWCWISIGFSTHFPPMRSGLRQKVDFFQNRVKRVKGILDKCHSQSPGWLLASRSQNLMISGVQYFNVHWVRKSVCAQPTVHWSLEPSMNQWWTITMMNCGWHPRQGSDKKMAWDSKVCGRRFWDWWMSSERTPCRGWGLGWRLCNLWFSQGRYFDVPGSWCICIMFFFAFFHFLTLVGEFRMPMCPMLMISSC